ncbi:phospholipase B1, membrane-associated-like [Lutzomyia longipalpis]|uniref:phospholipase B1, membrane-associated-like n=1 Tax=Lutzomyia longipalpis TaxID=7200 RepID=UPI002483C62A|nr:phospholipase B1, membrane-associated-like [Lutzomyia longipalpis]XP_055692993.1 phospholipase B1, membrane-associated-like [Lutzomyia longipalpis]XP_055692995.1 phospholipase B1, membrane-associated-like [Lutzomyia longipalpis]XP_055692996.1 phospholipase B1, membrane-associated-like [Lutzomyia longipalpis]XP_055692997.1 phospholipase B1, membrane-associated-like [Lutzomyia longipalpis]XP_055692998.1 phospholipase B1, membrane-associated-like [Lutzomyia longipalpis]XP_055692999.1 phosphol
MIAETFAFLLLFSAIDGQLLVPNTQANVISRTSGNLLRNLTGTQVYKDTIFTSRLDASAPIRRFYRGFREVYSRLLGETGQRNSGNFLQAHVPPTRAFPCQTEGFRSATPPVSVHQVRPGDVDIIAAVGDSLTTATAANSVALWEVMVENRGVSWSIGGQGTWRTHLTLPNIIKEFNPQLFGYSLSDSYNVHRKAQFNVAENIATTSDMPYNAKKLVRRMKLDPRVNMTHHWKIVTYMIGGNDFCSDVCYQANATMWINEMQEKYLIESLRYLRDNLPRTIVNLVPSPLISLSFSMDNVQTPFSCSLTRPIECSCLFGPSYSKDRKLFRSLERKFVKIMERVSFLGELHTPDFTVVFQPFFQDASVFYRGSKNADMSLMSIDCVHLSQKGHAVSANGLWNNMMEPVGKKSLGFRPLFQQFKCPTPDKPYIFTNYNS